MPRLPAFLCSPLAVSLLASSALAAAPRQETTGPFLEHDNVEGAHVRLATFPIRPMTFDGAGNLWIVNHHANRLERFDAGSTGSSIAPTGSYPMPADPVSVAFWAGPSQSTSDDEIIVVCRGTWAIVRFDVTTERVTSLLQLRPSDTLPDGLGGSVTARLGMMAEPGDVLVDAEAPAGTNPQAYVSCSGGDSVLQIDLVLDRIVRVFHRDFDAAFVGKHPLFLSFEPPAPGQRRKVLVAPLLSGNNTTWDGGLASGTRVVGLSTEAVNDHRLPDADLFRITPFVDNVDGQGGGVEIVARRTGTILFAHGVNQGVFWQLNTDARNAGAENQSEPAVNGRFSLDRITTVPWPFAPSSTAGIPNTGTSVLRYLDPFAMTAAQPSVLPRETVGQPFALAFDAYGQAFITGLLTDNVMILDSSGVPRLEWQIPVSEGRAIPRGLLLRAVTSEDQGNVLVYCWGDNRVREHHYDIGAGTAPVVNTFVPTADLTPQQLKDGRALFFSGANSQFQNLSCATCHVEGGSDMLVWNLSNRPAQASGPGGTEYFEIDSKGGMVTQSLVGIERLGPFHWRGEREFEDFNKAFDGLLGKPASDPPGIPAAQFAALKAYLFSLTSPANPYEHRERLLDDKADFPGQPAAGQATVGQQKFHEQALFRGGFRCIDCHGARTGTVNEINREIASVSTPLRNRLKPAPFTELWRKLQPSYLVKFWTDTQPGPPISGQRALLGAGLTHTGSFFDLANFVSAIIVESHALDIADIASFVFQFDSGIAPAVHAGFVLEAANAAQMAGELGYLVLQAERRGCDLVAFHTPAGLPQGQFARWFYQRDTDRFVSDRGYADRTPAEFITAAQAPLNEVTTFFALPVGSGRRVALDFDLDNQLNYSGGAFTTQLASRILVVGHFLAKRTQTNEFHDLTANPPGAGSDYVQCSTVLIGGTTPIALELDGASPTADFVATATPLNGSGSFTVQLPLTVGGQPLVANDEIHFVVDAVVEIAPNATPYQLIGTQLQLDASWPAPIIGDDGRGGFVQWDFPTGGEASGTAHDKL